MSAPDVGTPDVELLRLRATVAHLIKCLRAAGIDEVGQLAAVLVWISRKQMTLDLGDTDDVIRDLLTMATKSIEEASREGEG